MHPRHSYHSKLSQAFSFVVKTQQKGDKSFPHEISHNFFTAETFIMKISYAICYQMCKLYKPSTKFSTLHIQQNSFNPMSDNSEILIIRTLRVVPKTGSFDFYQNKVSSLKWVDLTDMFKRPPRVSVHQLLWYFLASCLLSSTSSMKTPENKDEDLDDPVPGDAQMK